MVDKQQFKEMLYNQCGDDEINVLYRMKAICDNRNNEWLDWDEIGYKDWLNDHFDDISGMSELQLFMSFVKMNDQFDGMFLYKLFGGDSVYDDLVEYDECIKQG